MKMKAARMYGYNEPLVIEEVSVPEIEPEKILLKVSAAGICRRGYQLLDGYSKAPFPVKFPYIPGHEIAGRLGKIGSPVPASTGLAEGDTVVVNPS